MLGNGELPFSALSPCDELLERDDEAVGDVRGSNLRKCATLATAVSQSIFIRRSWA